MTGRRRQVAGLSGSETDQDPLEFMGVEESHRRNWAAKEEEPTEQELGCDDDGASFGLSKAHFVGGTAAPREKAEEEQQLTLGLWWTGLEVADDDCKILPGVPQHLRTYVPVTDYLNLGDLIHHLPFPRVHASPQHTPTHSRDIPTSSRRPSPQTPTTFNSADPGSKNLQPTHDLANLRVHAFHSVTLA
ncbi:hypothetical protein CABS01_01220 [Colletotrichum abscissum]|uniref:uncharacterized protein n=1 Tax=Colletotrichum abscissum TaxID=1671311 RepID=UPI0027D73A66|nr:uncharacterized protein CABS01_01220 [Colletotrichum abscissum]KAK1505752.1 hypothetical protein CABS01_01220 [Colletotrichum abscissum]